MRESLKWWNNGISTIILCNSDLLRNSFGTKTQLWNKVIKLTQSRPFDERPFTNNKYHNISNKLTPNTYTMTHSANLTQVQKDEILVKAILENMPMGLEIPLGVSDAVLANQMARAAFAAGVSDDDAMMNISAALLYKGTDLNTALTTAKFGLLSVYPLDSIGDVRWLTGWTAQEIAELTVSGDISITPQGYYCGQEIINFAYKCSKYAPRADFSSNDRVAESHVDRKASKPHAHPELRKKRVTKSKIAA